MTTKKAHKWACGRNQRQFETPHSTKSVNFWLNKYDKDGILFIRTSILMLFNQQTDDEQATGTVKHRNGVGFSAATRSLSKLARKCQRGEQLTFPELNDARKKLQVHLAQLRKLWNFRYDRRKDGQQAA